MHPDIGTYFCPECIEDPTFRLSELMEYVLPPSDSDLEGFKQFVRSMPQNDHPAAFGQHPNADISSQIEDTSECLDTLVSLQPKAVSSGGESTEEKMLRQARTMKDSVPKPFNERAVRQAMSARSDPDPLKVVLLQEVQRYNRLLVFAHTTIQDLINAMLGISTVCQNSRYNNTHVYIAG